MGGGGGGAGRGRCEGKGERRSGGGEALGKIFKGMDRIRQVVFDVKTVRSTT